MKLPRHMKKFNKQDPSIRRHGPKKRREVISDLMIHLLESDFFDDWKTAAEIGEAISKDLSNHWTQVTSHSAAALIRRYQKGYGLEVRISKSYGAENINLWRFAEPSGETTEDKASAH